MKQGKFEAPRRKEREEQARALEPEQAQTGGRKHKWLLIVIPVLVLALIAGIVVVGLDHLAQERETEPLGMTKEETLTFYQNLAKTLERGDMVLTLRPDDADSEEEPIVLTVTPAQSHVRVDLAGLQADLEEGVGKVSRRRYLTDPKAYVSLDRTALRNLAEQTQDAYAQTFAESFAYKTRQFAAEEQVELLTLSIGSRGREITAEEIYNCLLDAYFSGELSPTLTYAASAPQPLDAEAIYKQYVTPPVDAVLNDKTFEIKQEAAGFGFTREELDALIARAEEGKSYTLALHTLQPAVTAEELEASLYADVLAEAHTPHSWVDDRTVNLMLACAAIDGTVVMPGQTFSFNHVVGERTKAKGYREATAYVRGASVPEIGGGVCQVASSIYYAVLQADLRTVERHAHTYLVTYVPQGMDAAIYWGALDYKFENSSPYPIRIDASVSDGDVHIVLRGTEWKDYSVKLTYDILEEIPWETKEQYVPDGSYQNGETIVSPYTGYRIATYRTVIDAEGNAVETTPIATSRYSKRDKVIAVIPQPKPTEPAPAPAQPPSEDD